MGMYTHLKLDVEIKPEFADEVEQYIAKTPRMLMTSYYFHDQGYNKVERDFHVHTPPMCVVHTDISLKNYSDEIRTFLNFLADKIREENTFCGFYRYEEDEHPTLIYLVDGFFTFKEVS